MICVLLKESLYCVMSAASMMSRDSLLSHAAIILYSSSGTLTTLISEILRPRSCIQACDHRISHNVLHTTAHHDLLPSLSFLFAFLISSLYYLLDSLLLFFLSRFRASKSSNDSREALSRPESPGVVPGTFDILSIILIVSASSLI